MTAILAGLAVFWVVTPTSCECEIGYVESQDAGKDAFTLKAARILDVGNKGAGTIKAVDSQSREHVLSYEISIERMDETGCLVSVDVQHRCGFAGGRTSTSVEIPWNRRIAFGGVTANNKEYGFYVKARNLFGPNNTSAEAPRFTVVPGSPRRVK